MQYSEIARSFIRFDDDPCCAVCTAGPLTLAWGNWFTLLGFLVLIKPIRERTTFFMLQFNSLDRPEDRPNTLSWIVGGNIIPGCLMIIFFRWFALQPPNSCFRLSMITLASQLHSSFACLSCSAHSLCVLLRRLYSLSGHEDMVYIFVLITGIGDGLAEPIGIYLGRHKYYGTMKTCKTKHVLCQR